MEYLLLGKIVKPHGLKGEVKIFSKTDFASLRYQKGRVVFYCDNNEYKALEVASFFKQNNFDVVSFKNRDNIELIKDLINKDIYVKKIDAILPKNHYHYIDLIDCKLIEDDKVVGKVIDVINNPANDCLRCLSLNKKEFDIPFVNEFIKQVDINKKEIKVKLIEGML